MGKMFIFSCQGSASQNDIGIPPHPGQNSYYQDKGKQQMLAKMQGKRKPYTL
jgi:hypothetical protein